MKLTIKSLSAGDFGNYRCISKNSLGETEGSIRVYGSYISKQIYTFETDISISCFTEIPLPSSPSKQITHVVEAKEGNVISCINFL
jgi:neurotrimin